MQRIFADFLEGRSASIRVPFPLGDVRRRGQKGRREAGGEEGCLRPTPFSVNRREATHASPLRKNLFPSPSSHRSHDPTPGFISPLLPAPLPQDSDVAPVGGTGSNGRGSVPPYPFLPLPPRLRGGGGQGGRRGMRPSVRAGLRPASAPHLAPTTDLRRPSTDAPRKGGSQTRISPPPRQQTPIDPRPTPSVRAGLRPAPPNRL